MKSKFTTSILALFNFLLGRVTANGEDRGWEAEQAKRQFIMPTGETTEYIARHKVGDVSYGAMINHCKNENTVALTFDDGPVPRYTAEILQLLRRRRAKATFFVTGLQRTPIHEEPRASLLRAIHADGHQVAHHTWSHADLSVATAERRRDEVVWLEMAVRDVLGFAPTYIRPPYGNCGDECLADLGALGYHVVGWDVDSDDWRVGLPAGAGLSTTLEDARVALAVNTRPGGIVLAHDTKEWTASVLAEAMIDAAERLGLRMVTVGECLGDKDPEGWYRDAW